MPNGPLLRVSNEGWLIWSVSFVWLAGMKIQPDEPERPDRLDRQARARCASTEDHQAPSPCYRMVASKLTLAFMLLEIRQFASAFSINSLALAASAFAGSVMVGFNVIVVN
jgi:hypothetical protein